MPLSYEIDTQLSIVRIRAEGSPSLAEQVELAAEWMNDPAYRAGMGILLDNRLRDGPSDRQHVTEVAERAEQTPDLKSGTRCAVVVSSDAEFGMTRMFASMSEGRPLVTKPFRDVGSAEQWLVSAD